MSNRGRHFRRRRPQPPAMPENAVALRCRGCGEWTIAQLSAPALELVKGTTVEVRARCGTCGAELSADLKPR